LLKELHQDLFSFSTSSLFSSYIGFILVQSFLHAILRTAAAMMQVEVVLSAFTLRKKIQNLYFPGLHAA
jgi:uncharacterized membrane protein (DUF485 family)